MNPSNFGKCQIVCWVIAVVAGMLAFWMAIELVGGIAAFMLGLAFIFFVGLVLTQLFCDGSKAGTHYEKGTGSSAEAPPSAAAAAEAASAAAAAKAKAAKAKVEAGAASVAAATAAKVKAAEAKAAGSSRVAAAVADKADTAIADKSATDKAAADKATADKAVADKSAKDKAAADKAAADKAATAKEAANTPDYDKDGVREGTDEGTRPEALSGPRGGKADNLKEIKGVGPKMEIMCNEMGFYHFDQIAAWGADEVAWVDANLKGFKGRVSRDNWVEQAKILAAGGETEFSKRVEDGDVY